MDDIEMTDMRFEVDEEGYLINTADWTPEFAEISANRDGLELTDDHWEVINFFREHYDKYRCVPPVRVINKEIGKKLGKDNGNNKYLYELFPYGPTKQASKYAGLYRIIGTV